MYVGKPFDTWGAPTGGGPPEKKSDQFSLRVDAPVKEKQFQLRSSSDGTYLTFTFSS